MILSVAAIAEVASTRATVLIRRGCLVHEMVGV